MAKKRALPKKLEKLKPAEYNPRDIKEDARVGLAESLRRFGDLSGITFNLRTGNLVCAHQRRRELLEMGADKATIQWGKWYDTPRGEEVDGSLSMPDGSRFHVRGVDWPKDMEEEANIAANSEAIQGHWDHTKLQPMLDRLRDREGFKPLQMPMLEIPSDWKGAPKMGGYDFKGRDQLLARVIVTCPLAREGELRSELAKLVERFDGAEVK